MTEGRETTRSVPVLEARGMGLETGREARIARMDQRGTRREDNAMQDEEEM